MLSPVFFRGNERPDPFLLYATWEMIDFPGQCAKLPHGTAPSYQYACRWVTEHTARNAHHLDFVCASFEHNPASVERPMTVKEWCKQ